VPTDALSPKESFKILLNLHFPTTLEHAQSKLWASQAVARTGGAAGKLDEH